MPLAEFFDVGFSHHLNDKLGSPITLDTSVVASMSQQPMVVTATSLRDKGRRMMTSLVDISDATGRLESGERPYAFEMSDRTTMVGPACGFGTDYLGHLREEGRYAESFEEASKIADARGATITGIWFVKA